MQAHARPLVVQEAEHSVALVPVGTCRWPTEGHHLDLIGLAIIRPLAQGSRLQIQELGGLGNGAAACLRPMAKIHGLVTYLFFQLTSAALPHRPSPPRLEVGARLVLKQSAQTLKVFDRSTPPTWLAGVGGGWPGWRVVRLPNRYRQGPFVQ
jgi:hypothetical protein